ncbi:galactose-1-phosphate uridylyltransferase [Tumidithrix helvetica PCC 7403]|uniref:galactose-1-phosphate uridylyltransferase n=1 Tax=Tumidithrix helvetica TaxID=3457545 RepID=UPI003CC18AFF
MSGSHIRLNRATREWVIYSPIRRKRPQDFQPKQPEVPPLEPRSHRCPFCMMDTNDREAMLLEIPNLTGTSWQTCVVPNKYPALSPDVEPKRSMSGIYMELPGYGHHEIVIESPEHDQTIATMTIEAVSAVIESYRQRYLELIKIKKNLFVMIFRNHGKAAGASLQHPHSQIIATPIVPRRQRWLEDEAQRYFDEWGTCAYCDMVEFELSDRHRVICDNEQFLAFIPYAAEVPFEILILPKEHNADFGTISPSQTISFAKILKEVLAKLYVKLKNPAYNYAILTAARYKASEPQLHWYCQIRPHLTTPAGFEMGSGIRINPSLPEADAAFLNEIENEVEA